MLVCVIKCLIMESYYYLLSISFGYVFCLHMLCIKIYRKTSVGETHHDDRLEFNHENQKAMGQEPRSPKLDRNRPESGPLGLLHGLAGPPLHRLASRFVHGQVWVQYTLFSHVMLFVSNQIENPLIKQLLNIRKYYFSHD
jgi:hypothetical protein